MLRGISCFRHLSTARPVPLSSTAFGDVSVDRSLPPLVILHGLFGQKSNWNSVAKALQRRLSNLVYCVDMRNHGDSPRASTMSYDDMAADVTKFLEDITRATGYPTVNLLGHSMGGKAAMRLAVASSGGKLLNRLIIEDVSPRGYTSNHSHFRRYIQAMKGVDLTRSRREILDLLEPAIPELAIRQFICTNLKSTADGSFTWKCNLDVIATYVEDVLGFSVPEGTFEGPTSFLYGMNSGYVPDSDRPLIESLFPQVVYQPIPKAGHWVHAEQPKLFIDGVCDFLQQ